jgi:hypothetical protein
MKRPLALAAVVAIVTSCQVPTGPAGPSDPGPVDPVEPVSVTHQDGSYEELAYTVNRDDYIFAVQPSTGLVASVPRFDPSLGDLVSAHLVIDGWLASNMLSHGVNPVYVSSEFRAVFGVLVHPDATLASLIGETEIELRHRYSGFDEDWGVLANAFVASVSRRNSHSSEFSFDQTFQGADAQAFVQSATDSWLSLTSPNRRFLHGTAAQSGLSLARVLQIQTEPSGAGTKPGIGTLILVAATLVNDNAGADHPLAYSDLHTAGAAQFQMEVTYTYRPTEDQE